VRAAPLTGRLRAAVSTLRERSGLDDLRAARESSTLPAVPAYSARPVTAPSSTAPAAGGGNDAVLRLREVTRSFGGQPGVRAVSLDVPRGLTTVLLGESGSGKSTLLRLMAGLLFPDSGGILFEGAPLTPEVAPALRRRMGFGLQSGGLFPHLTAADNVTLLAPAPQPPRAWRGAEPGELARAG